ncbi:MAG: hypothetical protein GY865_16670, partial [candidate division Zixibacteria bacterium]|nr:hypothetical protein [candidate division Zixibacteria bacterium]
MKQSLESKRVLLILFIIIILSVNLQAQDKLNDPYEIMLKSIEAIGGLDNLKKETSSYVESDISLGGLQGTINIWSMYPILQRQDLDLKVFKNSSGDNGEYKWSTDANGKVQILKDDELLKRRELSKLVADYDYLDRDSKTFKLHFKGVIKIEENDCYSILTGNNSNNDSSLTFINCKTFMTEKTIAYTPDDETQTLYSDYREIDGVKISFHQEITNLPVNQKVSVQITKYESNPTIDPIVFEPNGANKRDFRFTSGDRIENVPFEYIMNHIFIPVTVGCKERLWFLDTGAGISVIDSTFASELGLAFEGELAGQGVG